VRRQFVEDGLPAALERRVARRPYARKLDGVAAAHLLAVACGQAPEGHKTWTMQLLADRLVVLGHVPSVSRETVRRTLKKTSSRLGGRIRGASRPKPMPSLSARWKTC